MTVTFSPRELELAVLCSDQPYLTAVHTTCENALRQKVGNLTDVGFRAFGVSAAISTISNLLYKLPGYNESLECVSNLRYYVGLESPQTMVQYLEANSLSCAVVNYCSIAKTILVGTGVIFGLYGLAKQFGAPSADELEEFDAINYMNLIKMQFADKALFFETETEEKTAVYAQLVLQKKDKLIQEVENLKLRNVTRQDIEKAMSPLFDAAVKKSAKKEEPTEKPQEVIEEKKPSTKRKRE
ncbi:MAG: hypothetical protein LLF94_03440 [Chlamydiales bacterium]|nr:hypothetical protein [Chlamydiales bacterium]